METQKKTFIGEIKPTRSANEIDPTKLDFEPKTALCPLCQKVSWTGKTDDKDQVENVMNKYLEKDWCNCKHLLDNVNTEYPPKAGTGEKVDD